MWATSAGTDVDQDMATSDLRDELAQLPADQRRALLLAALFGFTAREIGEIEQIPLGTAKTRIRTAMLKLGREATTTTRPLRRRTRGRTRMSADATAHGCTRWRPRSRSGSPTAPIAPGRSSTSPTAPTAGRGSSGWRRVADELLLLAPAAEPPAGFEERVAGAIEPPRRRAWPRLRDRDPGLRRRRAAPPAAVWFALADDRQLADSYRDTLAVAHGQHFDAAPIDARRRQAGRLRLRLPGPHLLGASRSCTTAPTTARTSSRASPPTAPASRSRRFEIADGHGSIGKATSVDYDALTEVRMVDDAGHEVAASELD